MSDIYKFAAQNALRFPTNRGEMMVEQLFQMPLKSQSGFDLDTVARTINGTLKGMAEESFVEDPAINPRKVVAEAALDIVKDVIKTKQAEHKAQADRLRKSVERRKILDAIGAKNDEALSKASKEDLEKQLAALDAE